MKSKTISLILIIQITLILTISNSQFFSSTRANIKDITVEPGQSIQEAINNATEGQTIYVKKGEYILEGDRGLEVNKTITLLGECVNETIIDGQGKITAILYILANKAEIQDLTIRNCASDGFGIHIKDVTNVKIQNCHIKNCSKGIVLTNSTHCELSRNLIADSEEYGIYFLMNNSYNRIFWNNIKSNSQAISIEYVDSKNNTFYQNNFIQNNIQTSGFGVPANTWNNTYPAGGNYWSDYTHTDVKNGPHQNETGSDGIGDESYELNLGAQDHYPLMGLIRWFLAYQWETSEYYILVSSNVSEASNLHLECPNEPSINFTLTRNLENGFCRVAIPRQLLWTDGNPWIVTIDTEETEHTLMSDINYTYICFAYHYSNTKTIKIQGTHCIPEFSSLSILLFAVTTIIALVILKITKTNAMLPRRRRFQKA